ncbi:MAG: hypothetical protein M1820_006105 [Bogoriella megaspora]|nr:MAG: hypothetical protein M1820_006105 [Bogoriella megaspora]
MSSLLAEVKQHLESAKGDSRDALLRQLHEIISSLETSEQTATRVALLPLQTSAARIGQNLKIFETLTNSGPKSVDELQTTTKAHPRTLGRLLRYMASVGFIREIDANHFEANHTSQNLATPAAMATVTHFFENGIPLFYEMPKFLGNNNYQDVTDGKSTVFQSAYKTDLDAYEWFPKNPEQRNALIQYMAVQGKVKGRWLDEYPIKSYTASWDPQLPVFVDVGGNVGRSCALFKSHFPEVPGRVILQDLGHTLTQAMQTPGVETIAHDIFEPQPVKGAKFYHLGWILHNLNDEKCKQILHNIKSAMTAPSVLLINDMILSETGVPPFAASLDLITLAAFGGRERTMTEWRDMLGEVGFVIKDCIVYDREGSHGIIGAALP